MRAAASCSSVVLPAPLGPSTTQRCALLDLPGDVVEDHRVPADDAHAGQRKDIAHAPNPNRVRASASGASGRPGRPGWSARRSSPRRRTPRPDDGPARPIRSARAVSLTASVSAAARSATKRSGSTGVPVPSCDLLDRHQPAGLAVDDDLGDAAGRRGDDRQLAGHRLEVDDAERLVDRRADEHGGAAQHRDDLVARQHRRRSRRRRRGVSRSVVDEALDLGLDLGGVGCAGAAGRAAPRAAARPPRAAGRAAPSAG